VNLSVPRVVGVIVPARDEQANIEACLESVLRAVDETALGAAAVQVVVVADSCVDGTASVARRSLGSRGSVVEVDVACAGRARQAGLEAVRARFAVAPQEVWVATTDADTLVGPDWLTRQLELAAAGADGVAGMVAIESWAGWEPHVRATYDSIVSSQIYPDGSHGHVYGANLGVRLSALLAIGGFPRAPGEDAAVWAALRNSGLATVSPVDLVVQTSGRRVARAAGGLSELLGSLEGSAC
jgi:glycosyltransferase involved in cell wall biosynthesis